jgi:hypothetical protein
MPTAFHGHNSQCNLMGLAYLHTIIVRSSTKLFTKERMHQQL